jgi:hypothetical protein
MTMPSLLRNIQAPRTLGVPKMCAVSLLLGCDRRGHFTRGYRIASHRIFEAWRREDERQRDRFGTDVLSTDPGICRDEHQPSGVEITFLFAEANVGRSALDQQDFISEASVGAWLMSLLAPALPSPPQLRIPSRMPAQENVGPDRRRRDDRLPPRTMGRCATRGPHVLGDRSPRRDGCPPATSCRRLALWLKVIP